MRSGCGAGDPVLIGGAAGAVGVFTVQLVRLAGATVIGSCSEGTFQFLRELGAEPVTYGAGLADWVRSMAPAGVTAATDLFGAEPNYPLAPAGPGRLRASGHLDHERLDIVEHSSAAGPQPAFARDPSARQGTPLLPFIPNLNLYLVTCIDCRVDPAQILGVRLGEALVQCNIGGRITPAIIRDIAYAGYLVDTKAPEGTYFEVAIIHHTDCGSTLLADDELRHGSPSASAWTSGPWPTRPS
jgi:hypothetical protein